MSGLLRLITSLLPQGFRDRHRADWTRTSLLAPWLWALATSGRRLPSVSPEGTRIHLGCGRINIPGYINVDATPWRHVHYVGHLDHLPMFHTGTAQLIYASHCLEHFPYAKVQGVINEWVRVLKPGGTLRVGVPDFDAIVSAYHASGRQIDCIQPYMMGGQNYPLNFHYSMFNATQLTLLMTAAGLSHVEAWTPGIDEWSPLNDCASIQIKVAGSAIPISLNLQGVKSPS